MKKEYIEELIKNDIESFGCSIWGVELTGRASSPTLKVYIDKKGGISINDCEIVSKQISRVLTANLNLESNFALEVSSPGLERKFYNNNQYSSYIECPLKVRYKTRENRFVTKEGVLKQVDDKGLVLATDNEELYVDFKSVDKANLEYKGK